MSTVPNPERRQNFDRRNRPTAPFSIASITGSRHQVRRQDDREKYYYVDRYSSRTIGAIILILGLSTTDALLTLRLIDLGSAREINPVMDFFISLGTKHFLYVKYLLTAGAIFAAVILKNYKFMGIFTVKKLLIGILMMYSILVIYELGILFLS